MNRLAKNCRIISGLLVLCNIVAFFLPMTIRTQANYATLKLSQFDFIKNLFHKTLPYGDKVSTVQMAWILVLMLIPLIVSVVSGIQEIRSSRREAKSIIMISAVLVLYIVMNITIHMIWNKDVYNDQHYTRGIACYLALAFTGASLLLTVAAWIAVGKQTKIKKDIIPQVQEIKEEQVRAKYSIIPQETAEPEMAEPEMEGPHLTGLTGMYAGAQIPLTDNEYIKIGRMTDNDLVLEGQPKVSRNHCKIKWDGARRKYVLYDTSSNGTFIQQSEDCLPQHIEIELEPGTVIALGDSANTFKLK